MGLTKRTLMEFQEYDRAEYQELEDKNLEEKLKETNEKIADINSEINSILQTLEDAEDREELEDFNLSDLEGYIDEIKEYSELKEDIFNDIDRREELKKQL